MFILPNKENVIKFIPVMTDVNNLTGWYPVSDTLNNYGFAKLYRRAAAGIDMSGDTFIAEWNIIFEFEVDFRGFKL